jgi:3-hydroxyisobutyrate dehydrogenase-like beta-hydroxyacid dehydrogenase
MRRLRVGYVGLGAMGGALARRMMLSRKMRVFDVAAEVVRRLCSRRREALPPTCPRWHVTAT